MKLSEKIVFLRNKHQMSQGDLAEKLNVSRQSVSKWETGASIPDLDKLVAMSELFQVTMDELVKDGAEIESKDSSQRSESMCQDEKVITKKSIVPKVVGVILIVLTPFLVILGSLGFIPFGRIINVISFYLLLCGFICIFSRKNAGRRILMMTILIIALIILAIICNTGVGVSIH